MAFDKATKEWFEKHPDAETTIMECDKCGLSYKPSLGHKCKYAPKQDKNCKKCFHHDVCYAMGRMPERAETCTKYAPTADVVEVVRCGKCKHWKFKRKGVIDNYIGDCHNDNLYCCSSNKPIMRENDFCSYGERRTDNEV